MERKTSKEILEELASGLEGMSLISKGNTLTLKYKNFKAEVTGIHPYDRLLKLVLLSGVDAINK